MNRKTLILAGCLAAASLFTATSTLAREAGERPRHEDRRSDRQSDRQSDRRDDRGLRLDDDNGGRRPRDQRVETGDDRRG
jgi:hypothetical protein